MYHTLCHSRVKFWKKNYGQRFVLKFQTIWNFNNVYNDSVSVVLLKVENASAAMAVIWRLTLSIISAENQNIFSVNKIM